MTSAAARTPLKARAVRFGGKFPVARLPLAGLVPLAAVLAGCGAVGAPVARHPVTPLRVTDLMARQQGDAVVLSFTMPRNSTDQDPLPSLPGVEIYRSGPPAPGPAPSRPPAP